MHLERRAPRVLDDGEPPERGVLRRHRHLAALRLDRGTASSVEATAKQVSQPFGMLGSEAPSPPSGFPPVPKVA